MNEEEIIEKPGRIGSILREIASRLSRNESSVLVIVLIALIVGFAVMTGGTSFTIRNATNILQQSAITGVAALGQAFVILSGGIDLSVGGMATLCAMVGASVMTGGTGFPVGAIAIMLLVGLAAGVVNGTLVSRVGIPALIVTLATWQVLKGAAYLVTGGLPIGNLPDSLALVGQGRIGPLPVAAIIFLTVAAVIYLILNHTGFGRSVYATGGNPIGAWLSGVKTLNIRLMVYVLSGFCAGLAGLLITSRLMSGSLLGAYGLELDSIAAVCIGGVSLAGGRGSLPGVVIGVLIISVINNGMNLMFISPAFQLLVKGVVIIAAVSIDSMRRR